MRSCKATSFSLAGLLTAAALVIASALPATAHEQSHAYADGYHFEEANADIGSDTTDAVPVTYVFTSHHRAAVSGNGMSTSTSGDSWLMWANLVLTSEPYELITDDLGNTASRTWSLSRSRYLTSTGVTYKVARTYSSKVDASDPHTVTLTQ